jgi:hypothetical protein
MRRRPRRLNLGVVVGDALDDGTRGLGVLDDVGAIYFRE